MKPEWRISRDSHLEKWNMSVFNNIRLSLELDDDEIVAWFYPARPYFSTDCLGCQALNKKRLFDSAKRL
jgi:hypothetical protein